MFSSFDDFLAKPRGDKAIRIHFSRNTLLALLISIALHALVLMFIVPKIKVNTAPTTRAIEVSLAPKKTALTTAPMPTQMQPEAKPETQPKIEPKPNTKPMPMPMPKTMPKLMPKPRPKPKIINQQPSSKPKINDFSVPKTLITPQPSPQQEPPAPKTKPQTPANAPTDMASYIAQQRAKREAGELAAANQNVAAAAAEQGQSDEAKRDARIKNNFNNGTNGIFEITNLSNNSASFSFLGWTSSVSNARREFFEVEAKSGQDVRLAMIRRMIALIRLHYQGDFDWQSQRLGRTISKSARLEDSAELEEFLMQEFFGQNYKTKQ